MFVFEKYTLLKAFLGLLYIFNIIASQKFSGPVQITKNSVFLKIRSQKVKQNSDNESTWRILFM